ncbi:unnamed protein product [Urochloa decumbens]|uniref:Uncharacterized protein n=1 Tax=Urochloa decumbens TaxID=240449 RepID=A0ABC9G1E7_9POAL
MAVTQAASVAAAAHTAACCLSTASHRGTSRWALPSRAPAGFRWLRRRAQTRARARRGARATGRGRGLVVVAEFGGTYDDGFEDVHKNIINYFTYKATHTVLHQLYEMNPPSYTWLYNYINVVDPLDGDYFLRLLAKERQDLAERVMITRLHLYGKWIKVVIQISVQLNLKRSKFDVTNLPLSVCVKPASEQKCDHAMMYERISKENLDIMRQRLLETVVWPTDDTSTGESKD